MFDWIKRKIALWSLRRIGIEQDDIKALHVTLTKVNNQLSWLLDEEEK